MFGSDRGVFGRSAGDGPAGAAGRRRTNTAVGSMNSMSPRFDEASPEQRSRPQQQSYGAASPPNTMNAPPRYGSNKAAFSPPRDAIEASTLRSDEDMELIQALRRHVEALEDDNAVRIAMTTSLGRTTIQVQKRCADLEQKSVSLESSNAQLRHALEVAEAQLQTACFRAQSLEGSAKERDELSARLLSVKPLEEQVTQLKTQNESLEAQMADWKSKVKEALKEGKKREQQLTSAAITTQTEMQLLQDKLNEATFQLQAASARQSKQRVAKDTQTEPLQEYLVAGGGGADFGGSYVGSPMLNSDPGSGMVGVRRRRSMFQGRDRAGSFTFSPTMIPPALLVSSPDYLPVSPGLPIKSAEGGGGRSSYTDSPQPLIVNVPTVSFPHPLPPLNPQLLGSPANATGQQTLCSPKRLEEAAPEAPPFIVTVHFSTPGGWSIDAKQRVPRGMTVEGLMQQCARQFSDRYQQIINVEQMCIRMNHEKAKRSVVLYRLREIHSYSVFQRYQRDGTPIVLFLAPRDDMQEYVQHKMQQRLVEELSQ